MSAREKAKLLRIFLEESDKHEGRPFYEAIVQAAQGAGLAGATVLRGSMGFGATSRLHTAKVLRLSEDMPVVIEIVDGKEKIDELLPHLEEMVGDGLVTLEKVRIVRYRGGSAS